MCCGCLSSQRGLQLISAFPFSHNIIIRAGAQRPKCSQCKKLGRGDVFQVDCSDFKPKETVARELLQTINDQKLTALIYHGDNPEPKFLRNLPLPPPNCLLMNSLAVVRAIASATKNLNELINFGPGADQLLRNCLHRNEARVSYTFDSHVDLIN